MYEELEKIINQQESWTFKECLGLAAEHGVRTRLVVALVLACGKNYVDGNIG